MQETYDVVVIGAGPAAVAAISALAPNLNTAVVTGASEASASTGQSVHPKIDDESRRRREAKGVAYPLPFDGCKNAALFDTAAIGGLANYWGQQFIQYDRNDPWPADVFDSYSRYEADCDQVKQLFTCTQDADRHAKQDGPYLQHAPGLMLGSKADPGAGLVSMREAFCSVSSTISGPTLNAAVSTWSLENEQIHLTLTSGERIIARRVLLAAGVVGSLRLTLRSCPELNVVELGDHLPHMLYFMPRSGVLDFERNGGLEHFNSLCLERIEEDQVRLFASVYRMSRAPLSLVFSALGLPPWFPNTRPPQWVDAILPVQVWTTDSRARYRVQRGHQTAQLVDASKPLQDAELARFMDWLSGQGRVLRRTLTPPGMGFHFHAASVSQDGDSFEPLQHFLDARYGGRIVCVDSGILGAIGPRPHTLTAMAAAYRLTIGEGRT